MLEIILHLKRPSRSPLGAVFSYFPKKLVVRSKFSRGHCFLPNQNLIKKLVENRRPITSSKNDFRPALADLKSQAKLADVVEQSTNQIRQGETCRPIGSRRRKFKKWASDAKCQTATPRLSTSTYPREVLDQTTPF